MTPKRSIQLILTLALWLSLTSQAAERSIAFGSCLRQWQPQPIWDAILAAEPDTFVFVGDNVYMDTGPNALRREPQRIGASYDALARNQGFQALRAQVPIYATWDDHDYGQNDAGADYSYKEAA